MTWEKEYWIERMREGVKGFDARKIWEGAHGPIPPGYYIFYLNGDDRDIRLENLMLVK